jgi:hypothetical protein
MKTIRLNLALLIVIQISLSGCFDLDFPDLSGYGGGYEGGFDGGTGYDIPYEATFFIDSVVQTSTSKLTFWAHIQYDDTLIIEYRKIEYRKINSDGTLVTKVIQFVPDSINFRELSDSTFHWTGRVEWIYKYHFSVDNLEDGTDYQVCLLTNFMERKRSKSIFQCMNASTPDSLLKNINKGD